MERCGAALPEAAGGLKVWQRRFSPVPSLSGAAGEGRQAERPGPGTRGTGPEVKAAA